MSDEPRRAVFLDRDGVLNRPIIRNGRPYPPASLAELQILPDAAVALAELKAEGYLLVVVTNQPDVGRGLQPQTQVEAIHEALRTALPLDDFFVCYHDDLDDCDCRKPLPGLLLKAAAKHHINLASSFMIGDRWRDVDAATGAGCRSVLIDYGYQERKPEHPPNVRVTSLRGAVNWIRAQTEKTRV